MIETLLVVSIVSILSGTLMLPLEWVLDAAGALLIAGLALGVPTGLWYHVALRRALLRRSPLPARWWLNPPSLHPLLLPDERPGVLRWFYLGGAGFGLTALGCAVLAAAAVRLLGGTDG